MLKLISAMRDFTARLDSVRSESVYTFLTAYISKFLNWSALRNLYQSYRSTNPLPLLQRPTGVLINSFCMNYMQSC
jgi:hypothetical protein